MDNKDNTNNAQLYYMDKLRNVDAKLLHLDTKVSDIDAKLHLIEKDTAVHNIEFISVKSDLVDIKAGITWVTRLVIGSLVLAVITIVITTPMPL